MCKKCVKWYFMWNEGIVVNYYIDWMDRNRIDGRRCSHVCTDAHVFLKIEWIDGYYTTIIWSTYVYTALTFKSCVPLMNWIKSIGYNQIVCN